MHEQRGAAKVEKEKKTKDNYIELPVDRLVHVANPSFSSALST